jgi:hypothetical protein
VKFISSFVSRSEAPGYCQHAQDVRRLFSVTCVLRESMTIGTAIRLRTVWKTEESGVESRKEQEYYLFYKAFGMSPGPTHSISMRTRAYFPEIKGWRVKLANQLLIQNTWKRETNLHSLMYVHKVIFNLAQSCHGLMKREKKCGKSKAWIIHTAKHSTAIDIKT